MALNIGAKWQKFWFEPIDVRQYAALRIVFGLLTASYFFNLLPLAEAHFSSDGWLPANRRFPEQNGGSWSVFFWPVNAWVSTSIIFVGLVAALLMSLGWRSRSMIFVVWLVWVSLWNKNPLILDGDDAVLKIMCFYLLLTPCGETWSISARNSHSPQSAEIWPLRLMQFQLALIYFVSGWVKFHNPDWLNGAVIQNVLIHPHYSRWNAWELTHLPWIDLALSWMAGFIRWWEVLFPLLLLHPFSRKIILIIGVLFHLGLLATMNLRGFAIVMLSIYLVFIPNNYFKLTGNIAKN